MYTILTLFLNASFADFYHEKGHLYLFKGMQFSPFKFELSTPLAISETTVHLSYEIKYPNIGEIIKSGYLYQMNITVNVYCKNVEPEAAFKIADCKSNQISVNLIEK